jgi:hypothetical protein
MKLKGVISLKTVTLINEACGTDQIKAFVIIALKVRIS